MIKWFNTVGFGAILAILGMILGFSLGYLYYVSEVTSGRGTAFFASFISSSDFRANMLILALIPNPFVFFVLLRKDMERTAMGVLLSCLLLAIYIVALQTKVL